MLGSPNFVLLGVAGPGLLGNGCLGELRIGLQESQPGVSAGLLSPLLVANGTGSVIRSGRCFRARGVVPWWCEVVDAGGAIEVLVAAVEGR